VAIPGDEAVGKVGNPTHSGKATDQCQRHQDRDGGRDRQCRRSAGVPSPTVVADVQAGLQLAPGRIVGRGSGEPLERLEAELPARVQRLERSRRVPADAAVGVVQNGQHERLLD